MAWFKVDDGFYTSIKFLSINREHQAQAAGIWLLAGTWSADKMSDGFVPYPILNQWVHNEDVIKELIGVGLWVRDEDGHGIQFHDWSDYQPTRESLQAKSAERSQKNKANANKRWDKCETDATGMQTVCETDATGMQNDAPVPVPEPEPSIPNGIDISPKNAFDEMFDQFWDAYPRKENKQSARRSLKQALKAETLDAIIAGALRYRQDPNRDPAFTKHATTWLNNQCWNDDPLPAKNRIDMKLANQQSARQAFLNATTNQPAITSEPDWAINE